MPENQVPDMPIEFRCHHCQRLLRTADDSRGKQTRCPECGTILDIPLPADAVPEPALAAAPADAGSVGHDPFAAGSQGPTTIDVGDLLTRTWNIYSKNLAQLILGGIVLLAVSLAMLIPFFLVLGVAVAIAGALADRGREPLGAVVVIAALLVFLLACFVASGWIYGGFLRWMLKIARGQPNSLTDLFTGGRYLVRLASAGFLFTLAVFVGYLMCIVPGVLLSLIFSQFAWLIVDREARVMESFSRSRQITEGNRLQLFLLALLVIVINGIAGLVPFGCLFTMPFVLMLMGVTYLRLSGETPGGTT
jgi:hypothetical protein